MNDDITNQGPSLYDWSVADEAVSNVGAHALSDREDRIKRLEEAKARKLGLQSKVNNFASFTDTFTDLGDGILESNANKLWNDLNAQDIQSVQSAGIQKYALTPDEQGVMRFANGEAYTGKTRRLYGFGTQDHSNEEFKYGLASGKYKGSEQRYTPNAKYELNLGPQGVDIQDKQQDTILPDNVATVLEGLAHGRREALRARAVQDIFEDPDAYNAYGSGASEYYTSKEGLFGTPQEINYGRGLELLQRYMNQVSSGAKASQQKSITREERLAQIKQENQGIAADNYGLVDRYANTVAGFASAFTNSLFVSPAQAIGDLTGLYDISGTDKDVENLFGYNPIVAERAMQEMGNQWKIITDDKASTTDRMRAAGSAMLTSFLTPEMYSTSMGTLMSWMAPTALLKLVGVGSKFAKTAQAIDKMVEAGELGAKAAKVAKAKALMSVEGIPELLARQSGHTISAFGEVNNQYNDWVENNNGVGLEGADKAEWFAKRFGIQIVNQNLDKLVDFDLVTKHPGLIASVVPAIKGMTNKEFANVAKMVGKGIIVTAVNMGSEASQEYTQTMMELFNSRYGSEKFKNVEEFTAFLSDPRNTSEAGIAALAGAGGAPQFEAGGSILPITGAVLGATRTGVVKGMKALGGKEGTSEPIPETEESNAQIAAIITANAQRATTSTNPTAAYFSSFGSDNPEVRVAAQQKAQQAKKELFEGTHTVFSSDITPEEQINQLKALATIVGAEDGSTGSVEELSAAVLAKVKPATAEQEASLVQELEKAYKVGQQFASIKPMAEVAGEVSDGARGFLTYAAQAYAAMSEGDEDTLQKSLENLDRFYAHQETKLNRLTAGITEAKAAATAKAEMLVQNGTAKTFSDAITLLRKKAAKNPENGKTVFFNDQKTGSVVIPDVEIYRALENTGYEKEVANRGTKIFGIVKQVQNEVTAMKDVYSSLLGEQDVTPATVPAENVTSTEGTAPIEATIPSSNEDTTLPAEKERVKALADKLATRTPETKFTVQELQDLTNNAAEIETLLKNRMESQETDVPSMEDTGEFTVSATDREDGVTTDVVPKEFEGAPISEENGTEVAFEEAPAPEEDDIEAISEEEFNAFEEDTSGVTNQFEEMPMPEENDYTAAALSENDYTETVPEEFTGEEVDEHGVSTPTAAKKDSKVQEFITNRKAIKAVKQQIREARAALSREGITTKSEQDTDAELKQLLDDEKELTEARNGAFKNVVSEVFKDQVAKFAKLGKKVIVYLATPYINGEAQKPLESTIEDLVDAFVPTGFTLSYRSVDDVLDSTKDFASKLKKALGKDIDLNNHENYKQNPLLAFVFNADGEINYNVVEALQAAVYDFVVQDATNLLSGYRTDEEIAKILGMSEESIPTALYATLREGGVTLKLASASVGEKVLQNLGMQVDNVQAREALVTSFGIVALQGAVGTLIEDQAYTITKKDKQNGLKGNENSQIRFIVGKSNLFDSLGKVQKDIKNFEERLGVELEKERTYRKERKKGKENILIHRTSFQEAPKDHQDVVHRLENTAFSINSGHSVLLEMFSKDGKLDVDALVVHILGDPASATNFDAKKRYKAQKAALIRSITFYQEAADDTNTGTGYGDIFFNWFIAKNHRIHLDSNRVNPQNDKHLARWLLTTKNSHKDVSRKLIDDVLKGGSTDLTATAFLYSIVQAFDDVDGIPGIDKDSKSEVLVAAKMLLSKDRDELIEMAKQAKLLGHATLAIANIDKYNSISSADSFSSDMVLEVDGLTNGFAFRALQYPVKTEGSGISPTQWLEKVGVIFSDSELYAMESMSQARGKGQEDVYTSVGRVFQEAVINLMKSTKDANAKKWFALLGSIAGGIPDFSDVKNKSVEKFMRNLMKSPVMTFNYAAGANKIATSLVENHIMGTDYLSSKGIIDLLTAKEAEGKNKGAYKVTEQQLQEAFGKELGTKYHKARAALEDNSLKSVGNTEIATLRRDLTRAIGILYTEPLETTLEGLFAKQTEINSALASAAQFMFDYFKEQYSSWRSANPEANDADKIEYLRNIAAIVPGVAGASSDDQTNKIVFLKNMLEATNTDVKVSFQGRSSLATNTVSRGYNDPGVGPAVLTILSLDSSVMARTLNKSFSDPAHGALPIHDAIALGIGEFETITNYNQEFYTTNRGYSVIQSFVNAIEELATKDGMIGKVAMVGAKKDTPIVFELMKSTLERLNEEVNQARQELFSKDVKVGQLVGMEGTMAHINVKEEQELAKQYLEKVKNEIFGVLKSKKVVESLSKGRYNDIINRISTLLEGCK